MAGDDLTIEILKDIRDEIRGVHAEQVATNQRLDVVSDRLDVTIARLDVTNQRLEVVSDRLDVTIARLDVTNQRLDTVESTLLDLVEQQRFVVRYTRALSERDTWLGRRVDDLETRVEKLESE
ncbi:MAG TPA: hypothetical protein VHO06_15125 [Polyangia bacterium]|nr:hypothetical protein [Polyangia bacterium]